MIDTWSIAELPATRLALGLGDQELEQRLRPALDATDDLRVVAQCLAADQILTAVHAGGIDAVIVSWALHRLTALALDTLEGTGVPLVVLTADPHDARWRGRRAIVLPLDVDIATIRQAILSARMGTRPGVRSPISIEPISSLKPADRAAPGQSAQIIAVTGGAGSPGRTTVAVNLAASLGAVAPTILVDADLMAPALAAHLGLDPSRNMCPLAHAVQDDPHTWSAALVDEIQPLTPSSAHAAVLCGPPKREMRSSISPGFLQQLITELACRYRYVIVDVGSEVLGVDSVAACTRVALSAADHILLVSRADVVGLWHTRTLLGHLDRYTGLARVRLVVNQFDRRYHHPAGEVEHHLGVPLVAVIAADPRAAEKSTASQQPLVLERSSRAGRALLKLADHVHAQRLANPPDVATIGPSWWQLLIRRLRGPRPTRAPRDGLARAERELRLRQRREQAVT